MRKLFKCNARAPNANYIQFNTENLNVVYDFYLLAKDVCYPFFERPQQDVDFKMDKVTFGQVFVQFMIVWHLYTLNGSESSLAKRSSV